MSCGIAQLLSASAGPVSMTLSPLSFRLGEAARLLPSAPPRSRFDRGRLVACRAEIDAVGLEQALQLHHRYRIRTAGGRKRRMRRGPSRLAHDKAGAAGARSRLALVRGRRAAPGDQQIAHAKRQQHAVRQIEEATAMRGVRPGPAHLAGDMIVDRQAVHPDAILEPCAGDHVVGGKPVPSCDAPRLTDAELGRDIDDLEIRQSPARRGAGNRRTRASAAALRSRRR